MHLQTDFNGIPFKWGGWRSEAGLDCFGLADHVRGAHKQPGLDRRMIEWVYQQYPTEADAPFDLIPNIAATHTEPREISSHMDLVLLSGRMGICLATYLEGGRIVYMNNCGLSTIAPLDRVARVLRIHSIVYPSGLIESAAQHS